MFILYWVIDQDALSFNLSGPRGDFDVPGPWHLECLRAYDAVSGLMTGPRASRPSNVLSHLQRRLRPLAAEENA